MPVPIQEVLDELKFGLDYDKILTYNNPASLRGTEAAEAISELTTLDSATGTFEPGKSYYIHCLKACELQLPYSSTKFTYDGDGGRVKKSTVHSQQSIETTYLGSLFEIKSTVNSPQSIVKHIFLGSTRICSVDYGPSTIDYHYYHTDHLGSSNIITDETGTKTNLYEYTPYGETWRSEGTTEITHKFTGQELDASTGLYYYNARYYDPSIGRFTQADTLVTSPGDPQDLNRYSYCRNNPLNLVDPSGHGWFSKIWQSVFSVVSVIASMLLPALAPAMWAINMGISAWTSAETGNIMGFVGGLVGGAVFGAIGKSLALGMAARMGDAAWTFGGGALGGAVEFGLGGFGAGFGASLASGGSFSDSLKAGGIGAAIGGTIGAGIQGSYMAGWQDVAHGYSYGDLALEQGGLALGTGKLGDLAGIDTRVNTRTKGKEGLFLHGTNAGGAKEIASDRTLKSGSWVTKPYAVDAITGKPAIMLNPAEYRAFTGTPGFGKGEYFALVVAPNRVAHFQGFTTGGAPQWRIYGENKVLPGSPYKNPNP